MKKLSFVFKALRSSAVCVALLLTSGLIGLVSCNDDDEEEEGISKPTSGLVSSSIPAEGWTISAADGIATYRSADGYDEDEEFACYYAFSFENGTCTDGVYNVVCESESMAKYLQQMLSSGAWAYEEDDEEEEDYVRAQHFIGQNAMLKQAILKTVASNAALTRASNAMGITCTQEGKIVYFSIEEVKGLDAEDVEYVVKAWDTGLDVDNLPSEPLFGTWSESTGIYESSSIYAIPGTSIKIETGFNSSDILTKYTVTYTFPNKAWAEAIEEELREEMQIYENYMGIELVTSISLNDSVITVDELYLESSNITKDYIVNMIIAMDILNAQPIGSMLF